MNTLDRVARSSPENEAERRSSLDQDSKVAGCHSVNMLCSPQSLMDGMLSSRHE